MPPRITVDSPLILASGSRYRAELLARLGLPFIVQASHVDETPAAHEPALRLAARLAEAKARAVAARYPGRWVLGSDQTVACGERILGKPGNRDGAIAQLEAQSGRSVKFFTAAALLHANLESALTHIDITHVRFRALSRAEIERYVDAEPAFDCAGSFKCEGLGITLFETIDSTDPTALVGLPLIALRRLLAGAGLQLP